mgnify:CR=1 FL=1
MANLKTNEKKTKAQSMGMHTEVLTGRTQQKFFNPDEAENFYYFGTYDVDFNKRTDLDVKDMSAPEANKEIEKLIQTVNTAVNQLIDSKNIAASFKNRLIEKDKTTYEHQIKLCEEITKKADSLIDLYLGKKDKRQGITKSSDISVMQRIGTANWYASSRPNGLTTTEKTLIDQSKIRLEEVLVTTNKFFELDW